jgi:hypothetical protein
MQWQISSKHSAVATTQWESRLINSNFRLVVSNKVVKKSFPVTCRGRNTTLRISTMALERVVLSAPRPGRFTPGKEIRYPFYRSLNETRGRSGWVRKIPPPPGFEPRTVQPVARRYTDWAIPAADFVPKGKLWQKYRWVTFYKLRQQTLCIPGRSNTTQNFRAVN